MVQRLTNTVRLVDPQYTWDLFEASKRSVPNLQRFALLLSHPYRQGMPLF